MTDTLVELLLVEDNMTDAELTIRELRKNNMANNLVHMKDGQEALDFIESRIGENKNGFFQPKVILLDIQMPRINGIEVLEALRKNPLTKTIPVVMLTSSKEDPDIKKCYELGANSYIVKPVNFVGFAEAIKNLGFYWLLLNQNPI